MIHSVPDEWVPPTPFTTVQVPIPALKFCISILTAEEALELMLTEVEDPRQIDVALDGVTTLLEGAAFIVTETAVGVNAHGPSVIVTA